MTTNNYPDRISTSKKARTIMKAIDDREYFGLQDNAITRSELFLFAMALGSETSPTTLDNLDGLVLDKSIDPKTVASIYALFIDKSKAADNLDAITHKDEVYMLAQEYANTGFENIEDYLQKKNDVDLMWELLDELDKQYAGLFS